MHRQICFSSQFTQFVAVIETNGRLVVHYAVFVQFLCHARVFVQFRTTTCYMQADTFGVLTESNRFIERRLVLLYRRTTYINEIQRTVFIEIVGRRCYRTNTFIRYNTIRNGDTMRFDVMANQPVTYIIRRTLQKFILVIEHTAPVAIENLAYQITSGETQTVINYILRVHVISAHYRFAKFECQIHCRMMQEERLFKMNHIRPAYCFFYHRTVPVCVRVTERIQHRLHQRKMEFFHWIFRLRSVRIIKVLSG